MRLRALAGALVVSVIAGVGIAAATPASAANFTDVLDNPAYWQSGNQADIIQWINMSYGSSHPRYSTHRVDVLLDDGGRPVDGVTYLKLTTNFSAISGTTSQDEFVSAVHLPAGARIIDTANTPIFCRIAPNGLFSDAPVPFQPVVDGTCRQGVKDLGGNTFAVNDKVLNRGDIWEIYVPVAATRAMSAADGAGSAVSFRVTNAHKDATEPDVAEATNNLTIGAPLSGSSGASAGVAASSGAKAGAVCAKAGMKASGLTCVKARGRLIWKHR